VILTLAGLILARSIEAEKGEFRMNRPDHEARISDVDSSAWGSLRVFVSIIGKWWFSVWILTIVAGIISFGLTVANISRVPTAVWVGLLALGLVLGPSVAFHSLRVERDRFKHLLDDREAVVEILEDLEKLRAEAAALQIEGKQISKKDFDDWKSRVEDWETRTKSKLAQLHPAEAGNFNTLGVYEPKLSSGTNIINDEHQTIILNLIRRIDILSDIRDRWTMRT